MVNTSHILIIIRNYWCLCDSCLLPSVSHFCKPLRLWIWSWTNWSGCQHVDNFAVLPAHVCNGAFLSINTLSQLRTFDFFILSICYVPWKPFSVRSCCSTGQCALLLEVFIQWWCRVIFCVECDLCQEMRPVTALLPRSVCTSPFSFLVYTLLTSP